MSGIEDPRLEEQMLFANRRVIEHLRKRVQILWDAGSHDFDSARAAVQDAMDYAKRVVLPWPDVEIITEPSNPSIVSVRWRLGQLVCNQILDDHKVEFDMPTDTVDKDFLQELVKEMTNRHLVDIRVVLSSVIEYLLRLKDGAVFDETDHERQQLIERIRKVIP
jgi:predicted GTPase